ncbi:cell wall hydrolase [Butyrivibrio proteoclasticus B316]|uniref:Cell wall hydrolase n=1 Tax=Butyrivibrio proteoclasticus (strain ATCC 51982 / DSM 14932 / B316) TaxID=515622 RepID=E0RXI6_BUTPB|nr:cell wall hydrolase [Butyrivibrio proteoclasticus]ADL33024.1 cell wall hydrolase [Butyrivibrio proteoclasticus B316]
MKKTNWVCGKRIVAILAAVVIGLGSTSSVKVTATESTRKQLEDAKEKKKQSQNDLDNTKDDIAEMNEEKSSLQNQLSSLNNQLTEVSNNLEDLEEQIDDKEIEIENTMAELEAARKTEVSQYASMKKRVQFIYEKQNFVLFDMLVGATSFANFLNQNNYVEQLSAYDRKMFLQYIETRKSIEAKEAKLKEEKEQLDEYKVKAQAEQSRVSGLVNQTSGSIKQYANDISDAEAKAQALEDQIKAQEADIKKLEAKLAEEIRLSKLAASSAWRNISEVSFADGDRYLLANLIYCEAGSEPYEGKVAVGAVVINRVLSSVYPDTVVGVIYQNKQFSPVSSGRLALALAEGKATAACYQAADEAMKGYSNVGNCVYFRTPVPGLSGINIGGHVFY